MSAPRFFSLLIAAAALVAGGCAAPGAQRLQGAPDGMPPSLQYMTADVLGLTLYATDQDEWPGISSLAAGPVHEQLYGSIGLTAEQVEPWIGEHAGIAARQLEVAGASDDTAAFFADVVDRERLASTLEDDGWSIQEAADLPSVNGDEPALATRDEGRFTAAALFDEGVVVARTEAGLRGFLDAADSYAVPERPAMSKYSAEVATSVPAGAVFRFDFVRTQLRRPFQHDPAKLEFARWATESRVLLATRDGWFGLAPGGEDDVARIVGAVEWVPDLAPDVEWGAADRSMLDGAADISIAFDDVGQHLAELVRGITFNNGQYATEQDVPEGEDRVELEPLFEKLDGASAVDFEDGRPALRVRGGGETADAVDDFMCGAGIPGTAEAVDGDLVAALGSEPCRLTRPALDRRRPPAPARRPEAPKPPSAPIMWVAASSIGGCTGPIDGWVTFDGEGEMQFTLGVDRGGISYRPLAGSNAGDSGRGRSEGTSGAAGIAPEFCDPGALVPFS